MPDLTPETHYACNSHFSFSRLVVGSKGDDYEVRHQRLDVAEQNRQFSEYGFTCTCKAFKFSKFGNCKHINQVKGECCLWDSFVSHQSLTALGKCPECDGDVTAYVAMV